MTAEEFFQLPEAARARVDEFAGAIASGALPNLPVWLKPLLDGQRWMAIKPRAGGGLKLVRVWPDRAQGYWFYSVILTGANGYATDSVRPMTAPGLALALLMTGVDEGWDWVAEADPAPAPPKTVVKRGACVYFLAGGPFVKIGWTGSLPDRIDQLQTGCPFDLEVVGQIPGGYEVEGEMHRRFAAFRERGEWFRLEGALAEFVDSLREGV